MGKARSRKRARVEPVTILPIANEQDDRVAGLDLWADELDTTVSTLELLAAHPEILKSKTFKPLRTAVYDLHRIHSHSAGVGRHDVSHDHQMTKSDSVHRVFSHLTNLCRVSRWPTS
jgi:hypothetical protein